MPQRTFYQTSCSETDVICEGSELKHRTCLEQSCRVVNNDHSNLVGVLQSKSASSLRICSPHMESDGCEEIYEAMDKLALHHMPIPVLPRLPAYRLSWHTRFIECRTVKSFFESKHA